jgi:uncharacterized protein with FMN-binding domain
MNRAPIVLSATALGLAATLGFHAHRPATVAAPTSAAATTPSTSSSSSSSGSTGSSSSSSSAKSSSSSSATKTVTSDAVGTRYGNVQLKVTVSGGKITAVEALQLPADDPKSQEIGAYAEPLLRQSALSKQSASIDAVSGATYTSTGYQTALQSALDKAGFPAASSSSAGTA